MVEISLFRFDRKIDLESYYKPYIYEQFLKKLAIL